MTQISIPDFSILLGQIKKNWGKDIVSIRDCEGLSESILLKTKNRISPSTLFRWYVLNDQSNKPYQNTLNTLYTYLNSPEKGENSLIKIEKSIFPDLQGLEFISLSLQQNEFKGLLAYLKKMPNELIDLDQSIRFAGRIGSEIRNSAPLQKGLIPELIKTEQGRLHIIELFCDEDFLEGYFKETLEKYISIFPNKNQNKILEDFLFASHLLSFSYLLQQEFNNFKRIQKDFEKITLQIIINYENLHPMPRLRYHLMRAICQRLSFKTKLDLENETILQVEQLISEFPLWRFVILFELAKTAAILEWKCCLSYISNSLHEPLHECYLKDSFNYKQYIAEILICFDQNQPVNPIPFSGHRPIEYKKYINHIVRIKATLNNLK